MNLTALYKKGGTTTIHFLWQRKRWLIMQLIGSDGVDGIPFKIKHLRLYYTHSSSVPVSLMRVQKPRATLLHLLMGSYKHNKESPHSSCISSAMQPPEFRWLNGKLNEFHLSRQKCQRFPCL